NPTALPLVIEVRDGLYAENLRITTPISGAPLTLRAAPGSWPVISGSGGSSTNALSIEASDVTVSGFTFVGTAQRGIMVTSPRVAIDHNFFTADFSIWNADQFFRGTGVLLIGAGTDGATISNNTFYDCQDSIEILDAPVAGNAVALRNNIFVQLTQNRPDYEPILWFKPSVAHYALDSNYNLFYYTGSECMVWDNTLGPILTLAVWNSQGHDLAGIGTTVDPQLFDPANRDFHERSIGGRYRPGTGWVNDAVNSPAIDQGDPAASVGAETSPNGGVINLGGYGGTAQASRSP
ncbi:MAG TPA: hypothetical protein VLB44_01300, partial [Kofleriaceae bacterium]|nr:hypothetical protein [Kofleriaceae bacterium]